MVERIDTLQMMQQVSSGLNECGTIRPGSPPEAGRELHVHSEVVGDDPASFQSYRVPRRSKSLSLCGLK